MYVLTVAEEYECNNVNITASTALNAHLFFRVLNRTTSGRASGTMGEIFSSVEVCLLIEGFCNPLTLLH